MTSVRALRLITRRAVRSGQLWMALASRGGTGAGWFRRVANTA